MRISWKHVLLKILDCQRYEEGATWAESRWAAYGISVQEPKAIEMAYDAYDCRPARPIKRNRSKR